MKIELLHYRPCYYLLFGIESVGGDVCSEAETPSGRQVGVRVFDDGTGGL